MGEITGVNFSAVSNAVLVLFATSSPKIRQMVDHIKKYVGTRKVIVVGGYSDNINLGNVPNVSQGIMGIVFYGDNLNAGLHVQYDNSTENLTNGLNDMKKNILHVSKRDVNWDKSLMLLVSCVGRGEQYYGKPNVETGVVDKVFPGINTFGFFGFGEIGFDSENVNAYYTCNFSLTSVFC